MLTNIKKWEQIYKSYHLIISKFINGFSLIYIYNILCKCSKAYKVETSQSLRTKLNKYRKVISKLEVEKSIMID